MVKSKRVNGVKKADMQVTTQDRLFVQMISARLNELLFSGDVVNLVYGQLKILISAFDLSDALCCSFLNPLVENAEKRMIVAALLDREDISFMHALLGALSSLNKVYLFPLITEKLESRISQQQGRQVAHMKTTVPLDGQQSAAVIAALEKHLGGSVTLKNDVDSKILGGFVLRLGSRVLDASLLKDFYVLENTMKGLEHGADNS